jgi:hypothetical protein
MHTQRSVWFDSTVLTVGHRAASTASALAGRRLECCNNGLHNSSMPLAPCQVGRGGYTAWQQQARSCQDWHPRSLSNLLASKFA